MVCLFTIFTGQRPASPATHTDAMSQAERACLFFETATDVTFIGTPRTGANGDGRQLQRVGIQPPVRVAPMIRGVASGHDEVL
jgi:hypothetical protein